MNKQPQVEVGIMLSDSIVFLLSNDFVLDNYMLSAGKYEAVYKDGQVNVPLISEKLNKKGSVVLVPLDNNPESFFELEDVTLGDGFHRKQKENQRFRGKLKFIAENGAVRAINIIDLEDYLKSVISSEMCATSSLELLKAYSVILRSWLLANSEKPKTLKAGGGVYQTSQETEEEIIRWYHREEHLNFDVCADDHCQYYQGITKLLSEGASDAVDATFGEVLISEDKICDVQFSKCCGGISENFENVWEPVRHRYLTKVVDSEYGDTTCVDLRKEDEAELWIRNSPHAFCNTSDEKILLEVLPDFDQATANFYRWKVEYSQDTLSAVISKHSGIDFGQIIKLEPLQRGHSGRLIKLKIHGTKKTITIGKELEIRKWLSESPLYSSAFVIDHLDYRDGIPQKIILTGAGWGHGVGLCQIGAAVMGEKGYSYEEILNHYFSRTALKKIYKV